MGKEKKNDMSSYIWVLSFTVIGIAPEHHTITKYQDKQECIKALESIKQEHLAKKKQVVGSCKLTLRDLSNKS